MKKLSIGMSFIASFWVILFGFSRFYSFGFNTTSSMEKGFYYQTLDQDTLNYGDIISFRLSEETAEKVHAERYVSPHQKLLKFVAGLPGDKVDIIENQICVTPKGKSIACVWGEIKEKDKDGNNTVSLLQPCIIPQNKVLAMTAHRGSFDSRYFGLVDISTVTKMKKF